MDKQIPPWERPQIATIISIFNGRVASINTINKVELNVGGDKDDVCET